MKHFSSFFFRGLLALFLLALRLSAVGQAPSWQSAQIVGVATTAANTISSEVTATAVDAAGNVYLAGDFVNTVVLGANTLTSLGENDVFIAKYNPATSQFIWALRAGGTGYDQAKALVISGTSVYVAGDFTSATASFGPTTLIGAGQTDAFVAKLTDAGSFAWALRTGGVGSDGAAALAVSGTNVYVAGYFSGPTVGFGPVVLTSVGVLDAFVAKLTDAGSFVWAQRAGGIGDDEVRSLAVSGTNVYVAGAFWSPTASFGPATLTNARVGSNDMFVAKLTDMGSVGNFMWAQRAGGTSSKVALSMAVNGTSVYVAGIFTSPMVGFGAINLVNTGGENTFVAKLVDTGSTSSFTWALQAGSIATALAISGTNVYVAGYFSGPTASFGTTTLTNAGFIDLFVAKLTDAGSTGSFAWAQRAGGTGLDEAFALSLSGTSVYVTGFFSYSVSFGPVTLSTQFPASILGFLATLTDPTLTATAPSRAPAPAQLYPNPARHTATLRLPAGTAPAPLTLSDALGRVVRRYPAPAGSEAELDLRGLPAGFYLLRGAGPVQRLAVE